MDVFIAMLEWLRQRRLHETDRIENHSVPETLSALFSTNDIAELADSLLTGNSTEAYQLDADLLIRHASGDLFQEAHIQINDRRQLSLFVSGDIDPVATRGTKKHDAHFTPPSLARMLVDECLSEFSHLNSRRDATDILDPACGSGVFLIESSREIRLRKKDSAAFIRGMDSSGIATLITSYVLNCDDESNGPQIDFDVQRVDSSLNNDWGQPDVIVMNPPFSLGRRCLRTKR